MKKPFNALTHKDGGDQDMIAFDNPDDALEDIPVAVEGYEETMVAVDSPDDFADEGDRV
jgi:hypothetical protein